MKKFVIMAFGLFCVSCAKNGVKTADVAIDRADRKVAQAEDASPINAYFEFSPNSNRKIVQACRDAGFVGTFHFYTDGQADNPGDLGIAQISFHAKLNAAVYPGQNFLPLGVYRTSNKNVWHLDPGPKSIFIDFDHSILYVPLKNGVCEGTFVETTPR